LQDLIDNGWKYNDYADKGQALKDGYYVDSVLMDDGSKSEESRINVIQSINLKNIPENK
jgi:hypothetical protein